MRIYKLLESIEDATTIRTLEKYIHIVSTTLREFNLVCNVHGHSVAYNTARKVIEDTHAVDWMLLAAIDISDNPKVSATAKRLNFVRDKLVAKMNSGV